MASKRRNNAASTQRSQTPAKSEPKPNNEGQLNQEKLETLANTALATVTEQQFEQVMTKSPPEDFNHQDCWEKAQLFEAAIKNIEADRQRLAEATKQLELKIADLEKKEEAIKLEQDYLHQAKQEFEQKNRRQMLKQDLWRKIGLLSNL